MLELMTATGSGSDDFAVGRSRADLLNKRSGDFSGQSERWGQCRVYSNAISRNTALFFGSLCKLYRLNRWPTPSDLTPDDLS
jgi:hypothetical protein